MNSKKKILFFINADWFFVSHRLHIANFLSSNNFEVHVATNFNNHRKYFNQNIITHDIPFTRSSFNPLIFLREVYLTRKLIKKINPDLLHYITFKIIIIGAMASIFDFKRKKYFSIAGMGITKQYMNNSKIMSFIIFFFFRLFLKKNSNYFILQNNFDYSVFANIFGTNKNLKLIEGSGVDENIFNFKKLKYSRKILMATRLLKSKGVYHFCNIAKKSNQFNIDLKFHLAGMLDTHNPDRIDFDFVNNDYIKTKDITYLGNISNLEEIIYDYDIILILSSYGEGLPKIALEAMASGRIVIGLNNPGVNQIIDDKINGYIVENKMLNDLYFFINNLFNDKDKMRNIGFNASQKINKGFTEKHIQRSHLDFYKN